MLEKRVKINNLRIYSHEARKENSKIIPKKIKEIIKIKAEIYVVENRHTMQKKKNTQIINISIGFKRRYHYRYYYRYFKSNLKDTINNVCQ